MTIISFVLLSTFLKTKGERRKKVPMTAHKMAIIVKTSPAISKKLIFDSLD